MTESPNEVSIKVLAIQEENGWWSAQCLEHDIAAQAKTLSELLYEFEKTLMAYVLLSESAGEEPLSGIGAAPKEFWDMYEAADLSVASAKDDLGIRAQIHHTLPLSEFRVAQPAAA